MYRSSDRSVIIILLSQKHLLAKQTEIECYSNHMIKQFLAISIKTLILNENSTYISKSTYIIQIWRVSSRTHLVRSIWRIVRYYPSMKAQPLKTVWMGIISAQYMLSDMAVKMFWQLSVCQLIQSIIYTVNSWEFNNDQYCHLYWNKMLFSLTQIARRQPISGRDADSTKLYCFS